MRQAMVWGQKLLRDYEAEYEGEVSWIKPETKSWRWFTGRFPRFLLQLWRQLRGQNMYLRRRFRVKARKEVSGTGYAAVLS